MRELWVVMLSWVTVQEQARLPILKDTTALHASAGLSCTHFSILTSLLFPEKYLLEQYSFFVCVSFHNLCSAKYLLFSSAIGEHRRMERHRLVDNTK